MKPFNNTIIKSATIEGITFSQNEAGQFKVERDGIEITEGRMEIIRAAARKMGMKIEGQVGMVLVSKIIKVANL